MRRQAGCALMIVAMAGIAAATLSDLNTPIGYMAISALLAAGSLFLNA